jgi:N-acetylglucosamine-6-phosphate deacetylase
MRITARNYENGEPICITVAGERIASVEPAPTGAGQNELPYVAPGLFDLQINGYGGTWFSKVGLTPDEVAAVLEAFFACGVTRLCPTLVTASFETLESGFSAIRKACERDAWVDRMVPGCHLEGPYISPEDGPRGAHPLAQVRPPDWDEFCRLQQASGGRIRLVTLAPESKGAVEFIRKAVASGVVVSIGHTAASGEQIAAAVEAGARLSTHLGNGAHGTLRRHPNYIWEQLGDDRLQASLITDGHHLPPSVVRSMIRAKGPENIIITCDASGLAGCPPGLYDDGAVPSEILEDGRIVVAGQRQLLAGSGSMTSQCVARAMDMAGLSLCQAIDMAGVHPARLLGFDEIRLRRGLRADLFLFRHSGKDDDFDVVATVAAGVLRFGAIPAN